MTDDHQTRVVFLLVEVRSALAQAQLNYVRYELVDIVHRPKSVRFEQLSRSQVFSESLHACEEHKVAIFVQDYPRSSVRAYQYRLRLCIRT